MTIGVNRAIFVLDQIKSPEVEFVHVLSEMGVEEFPVDVGIDVLGSGDWANGKNDGVGNILSSIVVLGSVVVGGGLGDISGDILPVCEEVLGQGADESDWILEDLGPVLDLLDIIIHGLAVIKVLWELLDDLTKLLNSLDHVLDISLGEIRNGIGDLHLEGLTVLKALFDLWKVILLNKTVDHSGDELFGTFDVHGVPGGDDWSNSLNEFHCL